MLYNLDVGKDFLADKKYYEWNEVKYEIFSSLIISAASPFFKKLFNCSTIISDPLIII